MNEFVGVGALGWLAARATHTSPAGAQPRAATPFTKTWRVSGPGRGSPGQAPTISRRLKAATPTMAAVHPINAMTMAEVAAKGCAGT
jgi:hypothetical protein